MSPSSAPTAGETSAKATDVAALGTQVHNIVYEAVPGNSVTVAGGGTATSGRRGPLGGPLRRRVVPSGTGAGPDLPRVPARSRRGSRLSEKARTQKESRGAPAPWSRGPLVGTRSFWHGGQRGGRYEAQVRALIWVCICGSRFVESFVVMYYLRRLPLGSCHRGGLMRRPTGRSREKRVGASPGPLLAS